MLKYVKFRLSYWYLRYRFYTDGGWSVTSEMIEGLARCVEHIPEKQYRSLTRSSLQDIVVLTHFKQYRVWQQSVNDVIDIMTSGGGISNQYLKYQEGQRISLDYYLGIRDTSQIPIYLKQVIRSLKLLLALINEATVNKEHYIRKVKKAIMEGLVLLTVVCEYFKEKGFE